MSNVLVGLRSGNVMTIDVENLEVDASGVQLEDVGVGMAGIPRYSNQLHRPVSVAEHSTLGTYLFSPEQTDLQLQFLFHDCAEGLGFGDMHGKLKDEIDDLCEGDFIIVEDAITDAVCRKFGITYHFDDEIHAVDKVMGTLECQTLHPAKQKLTDAGYKPAQVPDVYKIRSEHVIRALSNPSPREHEALGMWLDRFYGIKAELQAVDVLAHKLLNDLLHAGTLGFPENTFVTESSRKHGHSVTLVGRAIALLIHRGDATTINERLVVKL